MNEKERAIKVTDLPCVFCGETPHDKFKEKGGKVPYFLKSDHFNCGVCEFCIDAAFSSLMDLRLKSGEVKPIATFQKGDVQAGLARLIDLVGGIKPVEDRDAKPTGDTNETVGDPKENSAANSKGE